MRASRFRSLLLLLPPALALGVIVVACGGGGGGTVDTSEAPFGLSSRPVLQPLSFPVGLPQPGSIEIRRAFPNLSFSRPVFLTAAQDGSDWVFVVEQAGRILVFRNDDATTTVHTFLDLRAPGGPVSRATNEEGMLGFALDPAFGTSNGRFWVHYSVAGPRRGLVVRYDATFPGGGLPPVAQPSSARTVLEIPQPYFNHNGGMLAFGPDGMLYLGLGDGGLANDPDNNGQSLATLLGKILRLDVRGRDTYVIPPDNPFVGQPGARGEIWAYGERNPWRFSFDRQTGECWVGDVGQGSREEVAIVRSGQNHGWPVYEGHRSNRNPQGLPPSAFTAPVLDYPRSAGVCVTGGYVYRGADVPSLRGAYVYGDYGSGRVWALVHDGQQVVSNDQLGVVNQVASFGEDHRAEVYAVSLGGSLWRFVEVGGGEPPPFPQTLSATGLFTNTASLVPNPGLIAFDVRSPLWSDGTFKRRWLALPTTARIGFAATGAWTYPQGTVLVKHFEIELRVGDPSSRKRLETRVLIREEAGWRGYTYRWNEAQTDADLLADAATETLTIEDPAAPGGQRQQVYDYPSRSDCLRCHTAAAGFVLGPRTLQMNRPFPFPEAFDNQLRTWNHIGLFDRDIGDAATYGALPDPADDAETVGERVRSYFEANCAFCHLPGGPAPSDVDLRYETPQALMNLIDERPTEGDLGLPDPWRVRSGTPSSSTLYERMRLRGDHHMPPLASSEADEAAVELVRLWILGL